MGGSRKPENGPSDAERPLLAVDPYCAHLKRVMHRGGSLACGRQAREVGVALET